MNRVTRRTFLATAPVLIAAGCRSRRPPKTPPALLAQQAARRAHAAALSPVPDTFTRTTPPPPHDLLAVAPELKGVAKRAYRLHPRVTATPPDATQSNLGGPMLWPAGEAWPANRDGGLLVPVLQLFQADAPPTVNFFPPGRDVLQLFWNPRFDPAVPRTDLQAVVVWRTRREVTTSTPHPLAGFGTGLGDLDAAGADLWTDAIPLPCRLAPERVLEFPSWEVLPRVMREKVAATIPGGEAVYRNALSVAPGTKAGGYAPAAALTETRPPACPTCSWGMDYLLTVAEAEWTADTAPRWRPTDDAPDSPHRRAAGLTLGPGAGRSLFACGRCNGRPVAVTAGPART